MTLADGLPPPQRRRAQLTIAIAVSVSVLGSVTASLALPTIAQDLGVSPRTVDEYRNSLFDKLKVKSRVGLVMYAMRNGLVEN